MDKFDINNIDVPENAVCVEVSKNDNSYCFWTMDKIKKAFNFGHGTIKDFEEHKKNNSCFCNYINV